MTHTAIESRKTDTDPNTLLREMIKKTNQDDLPMMVAGLVFGWEDGEEDSSANKQ